MKTAPILQEWELERDGNFNKEQTSEKEFHFKCLHLH